MNNLISEISTSLNTSSASRLLTVRQFSMLCPAFPEGGLRYLIFNAHNNGFRTALRRVGRKVLIDESAFFEWVKAQNS
jgi:hypothetical protein